MREAAVVELLLQKMRAAQQKRDDKHNEPDAWYDYYDGQAEAYADAAQLIRRLIQSEDADGPALDVS